MHVASQQIAMRRFIAAIRLNRYLAVHGGSASSRRRALCTSPSRRVDCGIKHQIEQCIAGRGDPKPLNSFCSGVIEY